MSRTILYFTTFSCYASMQVGDYGEYTDFTVFSREIGHNVTKVAAKDFNIVYPTLNIKSGGRFA